MLLGVDIAVCAGEIAGCKNMQKYISFTAFETDGLGITHDMVKSVMKRLADDSQPVC